MSEFVLMSLKDVTITFSSIAQRSRKFLNFQQCQMLLNNVTAIASFIETNT